MSDELGTGVNVEVIRYEPRFNAVVIHRLSDTEWAVTVECEDPSKIESLRQMAAKIVGHLS